MNLNRHTFQFAMNPTFLKIAQTFMFALLWATWIQPHTIAFRHILLTLGSILGLYILGKNISLFKTKSAIPVYVVGLLFIWITFHLFFLSNKYELQLDEYLTIWKRIFWGVPFAISLGLVMQVYANDHSENIGVEDPEASPANRIVWWVFYAGIATPTFIYLCRAFAMLLASNFGWQLPNFFINASSISTWHIPKTGYVFFCLPALVIASSRLINMAYKKGKNLTLSISIYFITIVSVFSVFYLENIKNGIAYAVLFCSVVIARLVLSKKSGWSASRRIILVLTMICPLVFLLTHHLQRNESWNTIFADIKMAQHTNEIDSWKYYGERGYPISELGKPVSQTNYERAAWSRVALGMIQERPLGYGLVHESFGYFAKDRWPDSRLLQSHSGWLDLTLGIGIPGVFLLVLAGVLALKNALQVCSKSWGEIAIWMFLGIALLMITTEVSQKTYLDALIFMILWAAGLGLKLDSASH